MSPIEGVVILLAFGIGGLVIGFVAGEIVDRITR